MCPPKVAQQLTPPPSIEGDLSNITAYTAHSGPGALMSWRRHHPLPPPMGGEQGAQRGFTRRGRDLGGVGSLPESVPTRIRYGMGQRASVAFLRALLSFCEKRVAGDYGETAGAFGYTPLSPHSHVVPCVAASLVARAARGRASGGTAPGGQRRARLADAMAPHGTIVTRFQHKSHECHRERRTPALECSGCRHAQGSRIVRWDADQGRQHSDFRPCRR